MTSPQIDLQLPGGTHSRRQLETQTSLLIGASDHQRLLSPWRHEAHLGPRSGLATAEAAVEHQGVVETLEAFKGALNGMGPNRGGPSQGQEGQQRWREHQRAQHGS